MVVRLRVALVLIAVAVLSACSSSGPAKVQVAPAVLAGIPVAQRAAFEDGVITEAEYRAAVEADAKCMTDRGYEVGAVERRSGGPTLDFSVLQHGMNKISAAEVKRRNDAEDRNAAECDALHITTITSQYLYDIQPSGTEREAMLADFRKCLAAGGLPPYTGTFTGQGFLEFYAKLGMTDAQQMTLSDCENRYWAAFPDINTAGDAVVKKQP